jgi:hypothetical protein
MDYKTSKLQEKLRFFKTITAQEWWDIFSKKDCIQSIIEMEINDYCCVAKLSISINRSVLEQINEIKKYIILSNSLLVILYHK